MKKFLGSIYKVSQIFLLIVFILGQQSCKKFVDVGGPVTSSNTDNVYENDATATAVLTGIYISMSDAFIDAGGFNSVTLYGGLSSDELMLVSANEELISFYTNSVNPQSRAPWVSMYSYIFIVNGAIEGLSNSESLTPSVKKQLIGEAKFVRALVYFYLVNLYGGVPLVLTTDYKVNSLMQRSDVPVVYEQIIEDLKEAQTLLNPAYVDAGLVTVTSERVRPTKGAASALLARVYLYRKDYVNAEIEASTLIENKALYDTVSLDNVFLKNSKETIWQLQPVGKGSNSNTKEGQFFIPLENNITSVPTYLSEMLMSNFESGDERKNTWVNSNVVGGIYYFYPFKYKIGRVESSDLEYSTVLRLAEQYLIRAEARAQQGKIADAAADLDIIRKRAGLPNSNAMTQQDILGAIEHERQVELFAEWGHRWLDLKRTNRANDILATIKGATWAPTDQLYPIPQSEIDLNPSLKGYQNEGY